MYKAKVIKFYFFDLIFFFMPLLIWIFISHLWTNSKTLLQFNILIFIFFVIILKKYIFNTFNIIYIMDCKIKFKNYYRKEKIINLTNIIEITGGSTTLTFKYKDENNRIKKIYVINQFGDKLEELIRELDAKNPNIQHDDIKYLKPWF